jgi:hypothetical protein
VPCTSIGVWRRRISRLGTDSFSVRIEVAGEHILTTRVDSRVHENDGSFTLVETKGFETPDYKIKKKPIESVWLKERLDYSYVVVKWNNSQLRYEQC